MTENVYVVMEDEDYGIYAIRGVFLTLQEAAAFASREAAYGELFDEWKGNGADYWHNGRWKIELWPVTQSPGQR